MSGDCLLESFNRNNGDTLYSKLNNFAKSNKRIRIESKRFSDGQNSLDFLRKYISYHGDKGVRSLSQQKNNYVSCNDIIEIKGEKQFVWCVPIDSCAMSFNFLLNSILNNFMDESGHCERSNILKNLEASKNSVGHSFFFGCSLGAYNEFVGHVFMVLKIDVNKYYVLQSYINKYTINYSVNNHNNFYNHDEIIEYIDVISHIGDGKAIDLQTCKKWEKYTGGDITHLIGTKILIKDNYGVYIHNKLIQMMDEMKTRSHLRSKNSLLFTNYFNSLHYMNNIFRRGINVNSLKLFFQEKKRHHKKKCQLK